MVVASRPQASLLVGSARGKARRILIIYDGWGSSGSSPGPDRPSLSVSRKSGLLVQTGSPPSASEWQTASQFVWLAAFGPLVASHATARAVGTAAVVQSPRRPVHLPIWRPLPPSDAGAELGSDNVARCSCRLHHPHPMLRVRRSHPHRCVCRTPRTTGIGCSF